MNSHNLSNAERDKNKGRAQILNIINRDVFDVAVCGKQMWYMSNALFSFLFGTAFLYYILGVSAFIGLGTVLLAAPLSIMLGRSIYRKSTITMQNIPKGAR